MKFPSFLFLFLLNALYFLVPAQDEKDPSIDLSPQLDMFMQVPQTPEAAAFVKYGDIPVQMYTGTPSISIPLFTLQGREVSIPLSLGYDASGIKVDQLATWVGLGWNLNAGGAVTRQVQGLPDGYGPSGRIFDPEIQEFIDYAARRNLETGTVHLEARHKQFMKLTEELAYGQVDLQPDLFPFHINGLSGTLFINYEEKKAYCIEHPTLKVEVGLFTEDSNPVSQLRSWKITGEDGTQYFFDKQEFTNHSGQVGPRTPAFSHRYVSAWYISKIISPNERDLVEFTYSATSSWVNKQGLTHTFSGVSVVNPESNSSVCGGNSSPAQYLPGPSDVSYWAEQPYLESIRINGYLRAVFYKSIQDRLDLKGRKRLASMNFYDFLGRTVVSHVKLNNGQPDGKGEGFYFGDPTNLEERAKRLMLKGVSFYGNQPTSDLALQQYQFEYFEPEKVPKRGSVGADMAGYYNGQDENPSLIPQYVENGVNLYPTGANREPDLRSCKVGTLKKIIYPTGGETNFEYNLHHIPTQESTLIKPLTRRLLSLIGGADGGRNPFGFDYGCFEEDPTTDPIPKGGTNSFSYNPSQTNFTPQKIQISVEGRKASDKFMYLVIYKSGECSRASSVECPSTSYPFCDIYNYLVSCRGDEGNCPIDIVFHGDPRTLPPGDLTLSFDRLETGGYQILGFNGDDQATLKIELEGIEKQTNLPVETEGGLRIVEKIDKTTSSTPASYTYYLYQDLKSLSSEFTPELALTGSYPSSGKRQFNPTYTGKQLSTTCGSIHYPNGITCERTTIFSNRLYPGNGHIGYSKVTEIKYAPGEGSNGFTVHSFHNQSASLYKIPGLQSLESRLNGKPVQTHIYNREGTLLQSQIQQYQVESLPDRQGSLGLSMESSHTLTGLRMLTKAPQATRERRYTLLSYMSFCKGPSGLDGLPPECTQAIECLFGTFPQNQQLTHYSHNGFWIRPTETSLSQYYEEEGKSREVVTHTRFFYDNPQHKQLTRTIVKTSEGSTRETRMYYPDDDLEGLTYHSPTGSKPLYTDSEIATIKRLGISYKHQLNEVVAQDQWYNGDTRIFLEKKSYRNFGDRLLPISIANSNGQAELTIVAELSYLNKGMALSEISRPNGPPQVLLHAYDYTLPVISLVGVPLGERARNGLMVRYPQVEQLGSLTHSDRIAKELESLRRVLPDALITHYSYNSALQLDYTTSPQGIRSYYVYDRLGRLTQTQDDDKDLLQTIEYHQIQPQ